MSDDSASRPVTSLKDQLQSLENLDRRISVLEAELNSLHEQRAIVSKAVDALRGATAPMLRVPVEILVKIFDQHIHGEISFEDDQPPHKPCKLVDVMLVCKLWQEIVVNSPRLWRRIVVIADMFDYGVEWVQRQHRYLDTFLLRSKDAKLEVYLDLQNVPLGTGHLNMQTIMLFTDLISLDEMTIWMGTSGVPWESCPALEPYYTMYRKLVERIVGTGGRGMARLDTLGLFISEDSRMVDTIWPLFDHVAPNLRRLTLMCEEFVPRCDEDGGNARLSVPYLCELKLRGRFNLTHLPNIDNLQELDMNVGNWEGFEPLKQLSCLRTLRLNVEESPAGDSPIDSIDLPRLRHLHIRNQFPVTLLNLFPPLPLAKLTLEDDGSDITRFPNADIFRAAKCVILLSHVPWYTERLYGLNSMKVVLFGIFRQAMLAHTIGVPEVMIDAALHSAEFRKLGLVPSLRCIQAVDTAGEFYGPKHAIEPAVIEDVEQ